MDRYNNFSELLTTLVFGDFNSDSLCAEGLTAHSLACLMKAIKSQHGLAGTIKELTISSSGDIGNSEEYVRIAPNLDEFTSLETLNVCLPTVRKLPVGWLRTNTKLKRLTLCYNLNVDNVLIPSPELRNCGKSLESIVIETHVLPRGALLDCTNLKTCTLINIKSIPAGLFKTCKKLTRISIEGVKEIEHGILDGPTNLIDLNIKDSEIKSSLGQLLYGRTSLKDIKVSNNKELKNWQIQGESLIFVDFSNNRMSYIHDKLFSNFKGVIALDITNNHLIYVPDNVVDNCLDTTRTFHDDMPFENLGTQVVDEDQRSTKPKDENLSHVDDKCSTSSGSNDIDKDSDNLVKNKRELYPSNNRRAIMIPGGLKKIRQLIKVPSATIENSRMQGRDKDHHSTKPKDENLSPVADIWLTRSGLNDIDKDLANLVKNKIELHSSNNELDNAKIEEIDRKIMQLTKELSAQSIQIEAQLRSAFAVLNSVIAQVNKLGTAYTILSSNLKKDGEYHTIQDALTHQGHHSARIFFDIFVGLMEDDALTAKMVRSHKFALDHGRKGFVLDTFTAITGEIPVPGINLGAHVVKSTVFSWNNKSKMRKAESNKLSYASILDTHKLATSICVGLLKYNGRIITSLTPEDSEALASAAASATQQYIKNNSVQNTIYAEDVLHAVLSGFGLDKSTLLIKTRLVVFSNEGVFKSSRKNHGSNKEQDWLNDVLLTYHKDLAKKQGGTLTPLAEIVFPELSNDTVVKDSGQEKSSSSFKM